MVKDTTLNLQMNKTNLIILLYLHNSPSGAIERVIYALLEKAAKDAKEGRKTSSCLYGFPPLK